MALQVFDCDRKPLGLETLGTDARIDEFTVDEHPVTVENEKRRRLPFRWTNVRHLLFLLITLIFWGATAEAAGLWSIEVPADAEGPALKRKNPCGEGQFSLRDRLFGLGFTLRSQSR
jgi:hypothetical protein